MSDIGLDREVANDDKGVEYIIETGCGRFTKFHPAPDGKRNGRVEFDVPPLNRPVGAAVMRGTPLYDQAEALVEGDVYRFTINVVRDPSKAEADIPMDEVGQTDRFRRLTFVAPDEPAQRVPARGSRDDPIRGGGGQQDTFAYLAALGTVELAYDLLNEARDAGRLEQVTGADIELLARRLIAIADTAQAEIRGHVDRNANSHTRARGALRLAIDRWPAPIGDEAEDAWPIWQAKATKFAVGVLSIANKIHGDYTA